MTRSKSGGVACKEIVELVREAVWWRCEKKLQKISKKGTDTLLSLQARSNNMKEDEEW